MLGDNLEFVSVVHLPFVAEALSEKLLLQKYFRLPHLAFILVCMTASRVRHISTYQIHPIVK